MSDEFEAMVAELKKPAPHERSGILRAHRAGWSVATIARALGTSETKTLLAIGRGIEEEAIAYEAGLPMHPATIDKKHLREV